MGFIQCNQIRKGVKLLIDGNACLVVDAEHVKPGKGSAFVRSKCKNLKTGQVLEKTYKAGDKAETADTEERQMQFLYKDDTGFHFMDNSSYEQIIIGEDVIGDEAYYLAENTEVKALLHNGEPMGVELPNFATFEIKETEPGFKGDTVSGTKPAKLSTGASVQVPFHLNVGDKIVVDTRTGEYKEKVG